MLQANSTRTLRVTASEVIAVSSINVNKTTAWKLKLAADELKEAASTKGITDSRTSHTYSQALEILTKHRSTHWAKARGKVGLGHKDSDQCVCGISGACECMGLENTLQKLHDDTLKEEAVRSPPPPPPPPPGVCLGAGCPSKIVPSHQVAIVKC